MGKVIGHEPVAPPAQPSWFSLDDGSGVVVRVGTQGLATIPAVDQYVSVIGASSLAKPSTDRLRLVLPRKDSDVRLHPWQNFAQS
jgi:hypothetical protein